MSAIVISRSIFELLVRHLTKMEDEKLYVLERYYPSLTAERQSFQEIMDSYINELENLICSQVKAEESEDNTCPFVIVGSKMSIKDESTDLIEDIKIISPFLGEADLSMDAASYLSPVGRAFLLKKVNDSVKVETPMGILNYRIEAIELPGDLH